MVPGLQDDGENRLRGSTFVHDRAGGPPGGIERGPVRVPLRAQAVPDPLAARLVHGCLKCSGEYRI